MKLKKTSNEPTDCQQTMNPDHLQSFSSFSNSLFYANVLFKSNGEALSRQSMLIIHH